MLAFISLIVFSSCNQAAKTVPVVGFMDAFEDNTIAQAKQGFIDALKKNGYSEDQKTVQIIYRNAQGDIPKLTLSIKYFISQKVDLIATCPTTSTIAAVQSTKEIPVFMMVSPTPELMKLTDATGKAPANLFGVNETLGYIDTSFALIPQLVRIDMEKTRKIKVGLLYNQSEPQSAQALERIKQLAEKLNVEVVAESASSTSDVQLATQSLLSKGIDVFFANPDNVVFGSFETIIKACNNAKVPVFTSEAGLVSRGAVAAYGADMYQWGYQSGEQAAAFLKSKNTKDLAPEMVKVRKRVYNPAAARQYGITLPDNFEAIK